MALTQHYKYLENFVALIVYSVKVININIMELNKNAQQVKYTMIIQIKDFLFALLDLRRAKELLTKFLILALKITTI